MSESTNETEVRPDDAHMGQDTQQGTANDGTEVEFTIPNLLHNLAAGLHQLLTPIKKFYFAMVVSEPDEQGKYDINTVSNLPAAALAEMLRSQAEAIEQQERAKSVSPEALATAVASLEAQPGAANEDKPTPM